MTGHASVDSGSSSSLYLVEVFIRLKPVVNDPEGQEIQRALHILGYGEVAEVRSGKYFRLQLRAQSKDAAHERVVQMCETLLANTVMEQYRVAVREPSVSA